MSNSTNISAPLVASNQAQKEVTVNTAIMTIDAILNRGATSLNINTPPASPNMGDLYIIGNAPTDDWSQNAGDIAYYQTNWKFIAPNEGMTLWVNDEDMLYSYDGSIWVASGSGGLDNITELGINATADATNRLSINSNAVLFNNDGGGSQIKVNKAATENTASHLFQSNFSGRAEFGIIGDDHYQVKVSPDGSNWNQAYVVDSTSGDIEFKQNVNIIGTLTGADLTNLDDTNISSAANGEVLQFNGSNWVNAPVAGASNNLATLIDANISSVQAGDFLIYDGGSNAWSNKNASDSRNSMGLGTIAIQNADNVDINGGTIDNTVISDSEISNYFENITSPNSSSGSLSLNLQNGNIFEITLTENVTSANFTNPPAAGKGGSFTLILKQDGVGSHAISWPASVKWASGSEPSLTNTSNAINILSFFTSDAGASWYGFLAGEDMK